jgi:hypothetical protein
MYKSLPVNETPRVFALLDETTVPAGPDLRQRDVRTRVEWTGLSRK